MYIGESAVETETEAASNDLTEYPHHNKPSTCMFRLYDAIFFDMNDVFSVCVVFLLMLDTVIVRSGSIVGEIAPSLDGL